MKSLLLANWNSIDLSRVTFYSNVLIKLVSIVFIFTFIDSFFQFNYLIGDQGIAPVKDAISNATESFGMMAPFRVPSLFWISSSNSFIGITFLIGIVGGLFALIGRFTSLGLLMTFVAWLSIINTGGDFFIYIWDTFLLELGFICLLISLINHREQYKTLVLFLMYFFIFRFWISMGLVKVLHNNTLWLDGNYMSYYFQNQPMPNALAYYFDQLPRTLQMLMGYVVLIVELVIPFFIFFRKLRVIAFICFVFLSIMIHLLGNFAWFNLLTIFSSVPLLVDTALGERIFQKFKGNRLFKRRRNQFLPKGNWIRIVIYYQLTLQSIFLLLNFVPMGNRYLNFLNYYSYNEDFMAFSNQNMFTKVITSPLYFGTDFKLSNPYGVFKGIPLKRWEIQIELSKDEKWTDSKKVAYRYKAGLSPGAHFFAPHFPRLEQQLFYEAQHGSFFLNYTPNNARTNQSCWTTNFISRLLKDADYTACIQPDQDNIYEFVRITVIELNNTPLSEYQKSGEKWKRTPVYSYILDSNAISCPLIPHEDFETYKKHSQ